MRSRFKRIVALERVPGLATDCVGRQRGGGRSNCNRWRHRICCANAIHELHFSARSQFGCRCDSQCALTKNFSAAQEGILWKGAWSGLSSGCLFFRDKKMTRLGQFPFVGETCVWYMVEGKIG